MRIVRFEIDENTKDLLIGLSKSPISLCLVLALCLYPMSAGVTDRMDKIVLLVQQIKTEHDATPRLLAEIRAKIVEMCGGCHALIHKKDVEAGGGHG